jgi:hypothetical protein
LSVRCKEDGLSEEQRRAEQRRYKKEVS